MNDIRLDYQKHGIEKCNNNASSALFNVIGYLKGTIENDFDTRDPKVVEFASELYQYIEEKVSEVAQQKKQQA